MKLLPIFLVVAAICLNTSVGFTQSVAPVAIKKGPFVGLGMHALLSINQENTYSAGINAQFGWMWKKVGLSVTPEFNGFQYVENKINSGLDFSVTFLGHYRTQPRISLALGTNIQVTQKITKKEEWDTVSDISIMGGVGKNWPVGPLFFSLSGLMKYNPSASDFSVGADISLNYPF